MYKNIICFFSFPFITQNGRVGRVCVCVCVYVCVCVCERERERERKLKVAELHTQGSRYESLENPFFSSFCRRVEIFLVILHSGRPRKFSWSHFLLLAVHSMHVDTLPSYMPPTQFTRQFHREYLCLVYFRYLVHRLMSKWSSSQYIKH